jgi:uncharacterized membrane protein
MIFATLLSQLIVNILIVVFLILLIILTISAIKCVNAWKNLAHKVATISFWINLIKKAPMEIFSKIKKSKE